MLNIVNINYLIRSSQMFIPKDVESWSAEKVLEWGIKEFGKSDMVLSSSFSAEDVILIDMMYKICGSDFICFTLDTGRLPQETYDVIDRIKSEYNIQINVYFPDYKQVEEMVKKYGVNLFYDSVELRKLCCEIRKVEPLKRALKGVKAWVTGLRREQSITRKNIYKVEIDDVHGGIVKLNPICDWNDDQVWDYIKKNRIPYNVLYDRGYASIGCAPCTRSIRKIEDQRSGRWWWEDPEHKECGIHIKKF